MSSTVRFPLRNNSTAPVSTRTATLQTFPARIADRFFSIQSPARSIAGFGFIRQNFVRRKRVLLVCDFLAPLACFAPFANARGFLDRARFLDLDFALWSTRVAGLDATGAVGSSFKHESSVGVPYLIARRFFSSQSPARSNSGPVGRGHAFNAAILSGIERASSPKVA